MANASPTQPRRRDPKILRKLNNSPRIGRFAVVNHFRRKVSELSATTNFPALKAFLPQNLFPWLGNYLKYVFTRRYPFPNYTAGSTGVYRLSPAPGKTGIRIAIAGDWATGTEEAQTIADLMAPADAKPDLTIHLGDVYYVGDAPEVAENCLGKSTNGFAGVTWPAGSQGSFALNGNHEMYANGGPYFTTFLSTLGMPAGPPGPGQMTSFFCIETESWRILGLDTGYNSVGIPLLSQIPGINNISAIGGDCHLEDKTLEWLRNTVKPAEVRKATLLLTHHQYYTAFQDKAYTKPAKQLKEFFGGQDVVWMWGHEHRLAIYDRYDTGAGIRAYGRCVGHSGMPVEVGIPDPRKAPLQLYEQRTHMLDDGSRVGENGFVNLNIEGPAMTLEYRDIANVPLLVEKFTAAPDGAIQYAVVSNPQILKAP
jgi:predicted phosphodiesterase